MIMCTDMTGFLINIGHTKDTPTALVDCNVQMWLRPMIKDPYLPLPLPEDGEHATPEKKYFCLFVSSFICFLFNLIMIFTCYFIYNSNPIYNF